MKKVLRKNFQKAYALFNIVLLLLQSVAPAAFLVTPAYAVTETTEVTATNVTLDFNTDTNEFTLSGSATDAVEYVLSYKGSDEEKPEEAVIGTAEVVDGVFSETLYAGTCSGTECVSDDVSSGTLTLSNAGYTAEYVLSNEVLWLTSGSVATVATVQTGKTYTAPQNKDVTVTFTTLPRNPGSLSIEEITLTDEQVEELGALSNVAYDITSSMENGSFTYELTLPRPEGSEEKLSIKHAESLTELEKAQQVETVEVSEKITAKELNHFTVFVVVSPNPVTNGDSCTVLSISGTCYDDLQAAVDAAVTNDVIELASDITLSHRVDINKTITLDGNQNTIFASFSKTSNSNNAALGVFGDDIVIKDVTFDGSLGTDLHGINTYNADNVTISGVTSKNFRSGVVVNGSTVTVENVTTSGNVWHGINVDQGTNVTNPSILTVTGVSNHTDTLHIYVDDKSKNVTVNDINSQYSVTEDQLKSGDRLYTLIDLPPATPTGIRILDHEGTNLQCGGATNNRAITVDWDTNTEPDFNHYDYRVKEGTIISSPTDSNFSGDIRNEDGLYKYSVRAVDTAGNMSEWSEWCEVTLDRDIPSAPTIEFPNEADAFSTTPILNDWTDVTDASGILKYRIEYKYDDGHTFSGYPYRETTVSQRNHTPASWEEGGVSFRVQAFDKAGNEGAWSEWRHYYYDMTYPEMSDIKMIVNGEESWLTKPGDTVQIQATVLDESAVERVQVWVREFPWSPNNNQLTSGELTQIDATTWQYEYVVPGTYQDGDPLNQADGANYFNFRPYDSAGNSHIGWRHNFTIDATRPKGSIDTPVTGEYITEDTLEVTGTVTDAESGIQRVAVRLRNYPENSFRTSWQDAVVDTDGNYALTLDISSIPDDVYEVAVVAYDVAGNTKWLWPRPTITIDRAVPVTTLTSPNDNDQSNGGFTIAGSSSDEFTVETVNIYYQIAGETTWNFIDSISNTAKDEPFSFSYDWLPSTEGNYNLKVAGTDFAGNEEASAYAYNLVYDITAPEMPTGLYRVDPDLNEYQCGDRALRVNMIPMWNASSDSNFSHFEYSSFHADGSQGLDEKVLTTPSLPNTWVAPEDGTYGFAVRTVDKAGNKSAWALTDETHAGSCQITYDSEVGVPTITAPTSGQYFNVNTIRAEWTEVADDSGIEKYEIMYEYEVNGSPTTAYRDVDGSQLYRDQSLSGTIEGDFTIRVRAYDGVGNVGEWSEPVTYTYDVTPPSVPEVLGFTDPELQCGGLTNATAITVNWTDSEDLLTGLYQYEYSIDYPKPDETRDVWTTDLTQSQYSGSLNEGIHYIKVRATDLAGNTSDWSNICSVTTDWQSPTVTLSVDPAEPDGKNDWYRDTQPVVSLLATDDTAVERIEYQWNGSEEGSWKEYSGPVSIPGEGIYTLYYRAVDTAGNVSTQLEKELKYDTTNPAGEPLNVRVENITADDADAFWEAPEDDSDIVFYELEWKHEDGSTYSATVGRNTFEQVLDNLKDGLWELRIRALDDAGNFTEKKVEFRVGPAPVEETQEGTVLGATTQGTGIGGPFVAFNQVNSEASEQNTAEDANQDVSNQPAESDGAVLGETTCTPWLYYLPLWLLLLQAASIVAFEVFRRGPSISKLFVAIGSTVVTILLFQFLKNTGCYVDGSWLAMIAQWFPGLSLVTGVVTKLIAYGFIEEA